jgi:hypothetical protein
MRLVKEAGGDHSRLRACPVETRAEVPEQSADHIGRATEVTTDFLQLFSEALLGDEQRRRHPVQLRDQPGAGQGEGVPGGIPRAEAGRPAGDFRCRQHRAAVARALSGSSPLVWLHRRSRSRRADRDLAGASRLYRCAGDAKTGKPRAGCKLAPGRGIENFVASATIEARKPAGDGARRG